MLRNPCERARGADLDPLVLHGDFEPASYFVHP